MFSVNSSKSILLTNASAATNATQTANVDCRGFDFIRLEVYKSVTNAPTVLKIQTADTTDATNFVDCGLTGGTDFSLPAQSAGTTDPYAVFDLDTKGFKRYLRSVITPAGSSQTVAVHANLSSPTVGLKNATDVVCDILVTSPAR